MPTESDDGRAGWWRSLGRRLAPPPLRFSPDELLLEPTDDGNTVALGRYHPRRRRAFAEPVVLAHSLGTNRFNLDFDERYSMARRLADRGFEVWVLELRGHGLGGSGEGSTFDVEVTFDVTAALRVARAAAPALPDGPPRVLWLGHSRGGLLALAHLARFPQAPLGAIATLAAPTAFSSASVRAVARLAKPVLDLPRLPLAWPARAAAPWGLPPPPVGPYLLNEKNVEPEVIRQALAYVVADVPGGVARQFARWMREDTFDGDDGFDYRANLGAVRQPLLTVAGAVDLLVPPADAHAAAARTGGPTHRVTAGMQTGFSSDYGHGDLVLGRRAPEEIIPLVSEFLVRHATPT
jgi:pimeloyl-ACP methyl ester carboxylesterase